MRSRMPKLCWFFLAAGWSFGQWETKKWIHSDARQFSSAHMRFFLNSICPGHERASGCDVCPDGMASSAAGWDVRATLTGHFLSPSSEDTLVSGFGCEPHSNGFSGSFLFTRTGASWHRVRYVAGMTAFDCRKLKGSDRRDRLVCGAEDGGQGHFASFLYLLDPGLDRDDHRVFFAVEDTTGAGPLPDGVMQSGGIDRVEFVDLPGRPTHVRIIVTAHLGKAVVPADIVERRNSGLGEPPEIATVPRRYEFLFDGEKVLPGGSNPPLQGSTAVVPLTSLRTAHPH